MSGHPKEKTINNQTKKSERNNIYRKRKQRDERFNKDIKKRQYSRYEERRAKGAHRDIRKQVR